MRQADMKENRKEMASLCRKIKALLEQNDYQASKEMIQDAMARHPHAPEPHNLFGLLLEAQGNHLAAMKHFRAAYALDPAYLPVRHNLECFGSFCPSGKWAYDESDCPQEKKDNKYEIEYDANGVGHVVSAYKILHDADGIGHVVKRTQS